MKKFLAIVCTLIFVYFSLAGITDNFSSTPDNKDHGFINMIFVLIALIFFVLAIALFASVPKKKA